MSETPSLAAAQVRPPAGAELSGALPGRGFAGADGAVLELLGAAGYVEEEYLARVDAAVYDEVGGAVVRHAAPVPATTRLLVRRPADPVRMSGAGGSDGASGGDGASGAGSIVVLELLDAPDGYDRPEVWNATAQAVLEAGHVWVGMTAGPVAADALRNADPERYAAISWASDPAVPPSSLRVEGAQQRSDIVLDGAEEGLVWDLLTGVAQALRAGALPGVRASHVLGVGHGYGGVQLNTFANTLHGPYTAALGRPVLDGYLNVGGGGIRRTLRQDPTLAGIASWRPARPPRLEVPHITVSSEADHVLHGSALLARRADLGSLVRHVQVPGAPHRDDIVLGPTEREEIARAKRWVDDGDGSSSLIPLGTIVEGAVEALVRWVCDDVPAPENRWLTLGESGSLVRDELGNVGGGVRTGLADMPLATMTGASAQQLRGQTVPMELSRFQELYGSRAEYFTWFDIIEQVCVQEGYITERGRARHRALAEALLDSIGVH